MGNGGYPTPLAQPQVNLSALNHPPTQPTAPTYTPINMGQAASFYGTYSPGMTLNQMNQSVPQVQTAQQVVQSGLGADSALPQEYQLGYGTQILSPGQQKQYEDYFTKEYINPTIAQTNASLYNQGRANSTFGAAQLGQLQAEGANQAYAAGLQRQQQLYQDWLSGRDSFFNNEGKLAQGQNAADVARGMQLVDFANQNNNALNSYNLNKGNNLGQLYGSSVNNQN